MKNTKNLQKNEEKLKKKRNKKDGKIRVKKLKTDKIKRKECINTYK